MIGIAVMASRWRAVCACSWQRFDLVCWICGHHCWKKSKIIDQKGVQVLNDLGGRKLGRRRAEAAELLKQTQARTISVLSRGLPRRLPRSGQEAVYRDHQFQTCSSLNGQRKLAGASVGLSACMERLSSGLRINSAPKDDAAGLSISERDLSDNGLGRPFVTRYRRHLGRRKPLSGAADRLAISCQRIRTLAVRSRQRLSTAPPTQCSASCSAWLMSLSGNLIAYGGPGRLAADLAWTGDFSRNQIPELGANAPADHHSVWVAADSRHGQLRHGRVWRAAAFQRHDRCTGRVFGSALGGAAAPRSSNKMRI